MPLLFKKQSRGGKPEPANCRRKSLSTNCTNEYFPVNLILCHRIKLTASASSLLAQLPQTKNWHVDNQRVKCPAGTTVFSHLPSEDICSDRQSVQFYSQNIINQPLSFVRTSWFADASYHPVRRRNDKRTVTMSWEQAADFAPARFVSGQFERIFYPMQ